MRDSQPGQQALTFERYLSWELKQPRKHEFVHGQVFAMSGVTRRHDAIAMNILVRLHAACRNTRCTANSSDVKVRPVANVVYYPDTSVDCGPHDGDEIIVDEPCLVVEVTSRSSARTDRGEKLDNYRKSISLRTYLIVDQHRRRVTCHRRDATGGAWTVEEFLGTGTVALWCPETQLTLDEIYEGVELPPLRVGESEFDDVFVEEADETPQLS